jgi:urea transport system ATP-binding protein
VNAPLQKNIMANAAPPALSIRKVNQLYGGTQILWDLDLDIPAGSCTCIMGRNGVGKTTLLK